MLKPSPEEAEILQVVVGVGPLALLMLQTLVPFIKTLVFTEALSELQWTVPETLPPLPICSDALGKVLSRRPFTAPESPCPIEGKPLRLDEGGFSFYTNSNFPISTAIVLQSRVLNLRTLGSKT